MWGLEEATMRTSSTFARAAWRRTRPRAWAATGSLQHANFRDCWSAGDVLAALEHAMTLVPEIDRINLTGGPTPATSPPDHGHDKRFAAAQRGVYDLDFVGEGNAYRLAPGHGRPVWGPRSSRRHERESPITYATRSRRPCSSCTASDLRTGVTQSEMLSAP
jgi:hypothetical protein